MKNTENSIQAVETTNNLNFTVTKTVKDKDFGKIDIIVKIRLDKDFAITGDIYEVGKRSDRANISGGCIHEDIEKHFPEFKNFIALHLADCNGIPMYAVENGFYHLQNGFNSTKVTDKTFKAEFCKYYRIEEKHFNKININDKMYFSFMLIKLGIADRWKEQAKEAIKQLEELTGNKFKSDKEQEYKIKVTKEDIKEIEERAKNGYYTHQEEGKREAKKAENAKEKLVIELKETAKKEIEEINKELEIKLFILNANLSIDNFIFYNHKNEGVFNWNASTYNRAVTVEEFEQLMKTKNKPKGVTFKLGKD
eukprot:GHVU01214820.1.p1 GENE.GHVU01214820.1~~GHVU01214820.1.p1  ORF type:complete len:309 (+),score=46.21 GHVU01214820.1:707-1633(+)